MTDDRDPILLALFAEADPELELDGEAFTAQVMARARFLRLRLAAGWLSAAAILLVCTGLLVMPLQELTVLLAESLSTALVDLGESWWAVMIAPINSVASVLVLSAKALRMSMNRIRSASYS